MKDPYSVMRGLLFSHIGWMVLHTDPGCTQADGVTQLGSTKGADCSAGLNSRTGCAVTETQPNSFGDGFNNAGGGVWATQFDESGIL